METLIIRPVINLWKYVTYHHLQTLSQTSDSSKLKEFTESDDNFKFDENGRQFSKR